MITIYKIGESNYIKDSEVIDKNSGYFEYLFIQNELSNIVTNDKVLIIINGKYSINEESKLLKLMTEYDVVIFIASDIVAITDNTAIINCSDYLLHQCPNRNFDEFPHVKQFYSWVPELFYKYTKVNYTNRKYNKLIFGGGVRDNENKITEYLSSVPSISFTKTSNSDTRLPYTEYLRKLAKYKCALVIARQAYNNIGWVTARYVEAVANNVIPICDTYYDNGNHFSSMKVASASALASIFWLIVSNDDFRKALLKCLQKEIIARKDNFKQLIRGITGGRECKSSQKQQMNYLIK